MTANTVAATAVVFLGLSIGATALCADNSSAADGRRSKSGPASEPASHP